MHTELLAFFGGMDMMDLLKNAWYLLIMLIGFSVIIFVHELGHFIMAKWVGIRVETFAIGFGPRIFGLKYGDTDYCIRLLPLGGYVKMMGQEDFALDQERVSETQVNPESFLAKTPGQRAMVVSGGVLMNVIFAAIAFVIIFMHGWQAMSPEVGMVMADSPAAKAGIEAGDKILEVNGSKVLKFSELQLAIALNDPNKPLNILLERDGKVLEKEVQPLWSPSAGIQQIGITTPSSMIVKESGMNIPGRENLMPGDEILKVDDKTPKIFNDVEQMIYAAQGEPVKLTVKRTVEGKEEIVTVMKQAHLVLMAEPKTFTSETSDEKELVGQNFSMLGLTPRRTFLFTPAADTETGPSAEEAGNWATAGDVILKVGEISDPTDTEIRDFMDKHRGEKVQITVLRDNEIKNKINLYVPLRKYYFDALLAQLGFDDHHPVVANVVKGSPAGSLNLPRGAILTACNDKPVTNWFQLLNCFKENKGKEVVIAYTSNGEKKTGTMTIPEDSAWLDRIAYAIDFYNAPLYTTIKGKYPHQAFMLGMRETWTFIKSAYVMLQRLAIDRTIGAKQLSGPLFIINKGREAAEAGFYVLLYYLALISANLAVINFLPIPVVDGGLMILLGLEKLRGKPLSGKSTAIWQGVGLSLIVLLFAFVTYNDIARMIHGG
jgi:regulator of sigma E protease